MVGEPFPLAQRHGKENKSSYIFKIIFGNKIDLVMKEKWIEIKIPKEFLIRSEKITPKKFNCPNKKDSPSKNK